MAANYGTITHNSNTLTLTQHAYVTCRVFDGCFQGAADGETYTMEYAARAVDAYGNEYRVVWHFEAVKCQEPEDEGSYDWSTYTLTDY